MNKPEFKNIESQSYKVIDSESKEKTIYHNRAVTVNVVQFLIKKESEVNSDVYVLIGKRGKDSFDYQDKLNLPCGHLDWNESIVECGIREMYEETGFIDPTIQYHLLNINSDINNNRQNVEINLVGHIEINNTDEFPTVISNNEMTDVRWEPITNIINEYNDHVEKNTINENWAFKHDLLILQSFKQYFNIDNEKQ